MLDIGGGSLHFVTLERGSGGLPSNPLSPLKLERVVMPTPSEGGNLLYKLQKFY
jgi:hypothetical protein